MNKWLTVFNSLLLAFSLSACSISHRVSYEDGEGSVPHSFFHDIKNNKTEKNWIVANLGEPHYSQQGPDQQEIYTYQLTRSFNKHGDLLFFFRYNGAERETEYFHVLFDADLVKRHWMDDYAQVQSHKAFKPAKTTEMEPAPGEASQPVQQPISKSELPDADAGDMSADRAPAPTPTPEPANYYVPQTSEFRI